MAAPIESTDVAAYLKLDDGRDSDLLVPVVAAVNDYMVALKGDLVEWPPRFVQGGIMLAARLYRRRNSPAGVEAFGELGGVYVQRNDPDVALMLELGVYKRPLIG